MNEFPHRFSSITFHAGTKDNLWAWMSLSISRAVEWYPSHRVVVVDCCSVSILVFRVSPPRNLASTSTKHSDNLKLTSFCSNPAKLSIHEPTHIICRWEEGTDVVNGRVCTQTIVMLVFLTSQHNKSYPPKMTTWDSLAELSNQMAGKCYRTSK